MLGYPNIKKILLILFCGNMGIYMISTIICSPYNRVQTANIGLDWEVIFENTHKILGF
jgi:hypothetical protein